MARIVILMSTYNGEKYLVEQLDSIRNQTFTDWQLLIRDDGSTDSTREIIRRYTEKDRRICSDINSKNIGLVGSFFKLLKKDDFEFYMFSDQDDYWKVDKIEKSLEAISKMDNSNPCLVHTNLEIVDENLNLISNTMKKKPYLRTFKQLCFVNNVTGCTMIFNKKLKEKVIDSLNNTENIFVHDWWIALVASYFGEVEYLNLSTIKYRQHSNNVLGSYRKDRSFYKSVMMKIHGDGNFTIKMSELLKQLVKFADLYEETTSFLTDVRKLSSSNILYRFIFLVKYRIVMESFMRSVEFYLLFLFSFKKFNL